MDNYSLWLQNATGGVKEELEKMQGDNALLSDAFYKELSFGTGGLRGVVGAGTNRMNIYTVGRATFGFCDYLLQEENEASVVIAYDSRRMSKEFAEEIAKITTFRGIKTYLFQELMPTPVLSFAVRKLHATGGIVITASHNPKEYNGYKVYNHNGCQVTDNVAAEITKYISRHGYFNEYEENPALLSRLDDGVLNEFLQAVRAYSLEEVNKSALPKIVYTPLHGTGRVPVQRLLKQMGVCDLKTVKEQELPDSEFTTCPYPNPEERSALTLAVNEARLFAADLAIATDPDADRVGVVARNDEGDYVLLNGNETGVLIEDYMLSRRLAHGVSGGTVIKTIVTSDMAKAVASRYGANVKEVLTGFKYIGEAMESVNNFVLGMEESYGYLVGKHARDKDSVSAVMMVVEMASFYKAQGKTLCTRLSELYREHGYYKTLLVNKSYPGQDGMQKMQEVVSALRAQPLKAIAGYPVTAYRDYQNGLDGLPKSDVQSFLGEGFKVIVRPSGTEPKLKAYLEVKGASMAQAEEIARAMQKEIEAIL